ncbi:hypothetical protein ASPBRDRAFT_53581 [Aspergillus brasiliensis CBS 101740]|uniref:Uncharacterized protein n=1 Tax=Aspergillus brasiliensis (strain CBS 101740 / IMI 381727 / IBT 21946) TaxID=767769 RepID=A0A1L9UNW4_ASPBC|nr:hypothetical protein ASPBRDRAFT_53581 [Aspergillus brasiliensis CBS 101740]
MSPNFHPVNLDSPCSTADLTSDPDIIPTIEHNIDNASNLDYFIPQGFPTNPTFTNHNDPNLNESFQVDVSELVTEANRFWDDHSPVLATNEERPSSGESYPSTYMMESDDANMHETAASYAPFDNSQVIGAEMDMEMMTIGNENETEEANEIYEAEQAHNVMLAALGLASLNRGGSHAVDNDDDDAETSSSVTYDDDSEGKERKASGGVRLTPTERMNQAGVAAWLGMECEEQNGELLQYGGQDEDDYDEDETISFVYDDDMMEMGEGVVDEVVNVVDGPSRQVLISSQPGTVAEYDTASFECDFEEPQQQQEEQETEERWDGDGQHPPPPSPSPRFYTNNRPTELIIEYSSSDDDNNAEETMSDPSSSSSETPLDAPTPQLHSTPWTTSISTSTSSTSSTSSFPTDTDTDTPAQIPYPPQPQTTPFTLLTDLHTHLNQSPQNRAIHLRNLANEISNTMSFVNSKTIAGDFTSEDAAPVDRVMRIVREGELKMRYQERYERQKGKLVNRERRVAEREDRVRKREERVSQREMGAAGWWEVWRERGREVWEGVESDLYGEGDRDGYRRNAMDTLQKTVRVTKEVVRRMDQMIEDDGQSGTSGSGSGSEIDRDDVEGGVGIRTGIEEYWRMRLRGRVGSTE